MTTTHDHSPALPRWSASAAEWLIGAMLVTGPLTLGATEAWGQIIVLPLIALAALIVLAGVWSSPDARLLWSWAYLPIAVLLAVVIAGRVPLPTILQQWLAPGVTALRHDLLQLAGRPVEARSPISVYPLETERQLRLLVFGAMLFFVVLQVYARDSARRRRLLRTMAGVGLTMALLALGQYAFHSQTILGIAARGNPYSGTFANHSHFGQFINLSLGAAAAILLLNVRELRSSGLTAAGVRDALTQADRWDAWMSAALLITGPVAVLISMTRGGALSMFFGAAAMIAIVTYSERRRHRSDVAFIVLLAGGAVLVLLLALGFNAAFDRLASLRHLDESGGGRIEIIRDAVRVWRTSPWIGTGLGTHAFVFPAFDRSFIGKWASHAENEYVQLLEETGILGLAAALGFIAVVFAALARGIRTLRQSDATSLASLPGLSLGLIAVALHSATDFGQHVPAVAFLTAITSALVIAMTLAPRVASPRRQTLERTRVAVVMCALAAAIAFFTPGLMRDNRAERAWWSATIERAVLDDKGWNIHSTEYHDLLIDARTAAQAQPRDVEYAFWLNAWRWEAIAQQVDAGGRLDAQLAGWTQQMLSELLATVDECPTFGRPIAFAGQLARQLPAGSLKPNEMIVRGAELAPYDPQACIAAGRVAAIAGDVERASRLLRRAVAVGDTRAAAIDIFVNILNDPAAAESIARDDVNALDALAAQLAKRPAAADALLRITTERNALIDRQAADPAASPAMLDRAAQRAIESGDRDRAIAMLSKAASLDYANADRRLLLAKLLAEKGQYGQAVAQARIALRLRQDDAAIKQQIEIWTHLSPLPQ